MSHKYTEFKTNFPKYFTTSINNTEAYILAIQTQTFTLKPKVTAAYTW